MYFCICELGVGSGSWFKIWWVVKKFESHCLGVEGMWTTQWGPAPGAEVPEDCVGAVGRMRSCKPQAVVNEGLGFSQCLQAIRRRLQFSYLTVAVDSRWGGTLTPRSLRGGWPLWCWSCHKVILLSPTISTGKSYTWESDPTLCRRGEHSII